ncbi:hypothetical protein MP228_002324 [Amoeboaphelidium protococcarum]|nr:hypothetical protein MP228_002324 [Amoeboaphelidium protococcarum]
MMDTVYKKDENVLCFHGPLMYEAKILKAEYWSALDHGENEGNHYFVHYKGWKQKWDEWVPESRICKINEENLARQKDLQAIHAIRRDEGKKGGGDGAQSIAGSKRKHNNQTSSSQRETSVESEADYLKRPEIQLTIPDILKVQLVDDWEYITKEQRLVSLPRQPTVQQVLQEYKEQAVQKVKLQLQKDIIAEVVAGLQVYFDRALGNILLYRQERLQYADFIKQNPDCLTSPSLFYGAEHLLRLFVQMPSLVAHTTMDQDSILLLRDQMTSIVEYLAKNQDKFFMKEYDNAPPEYLTRH